MANANNEEPTTAPEPGCWYDLTLGPSFTDHSRFHTLRYDFKPASIDKSEPGLLHKDINKRVTVEYNNNQPGKPKLVFEGVSEDYKDNDGVLFFDGHSFRLERLHRAVKRLRHVRQPGEPAAGVAATLVANPPPLADKATKFEGVDQHAPVQMQHTVTGGLNLPAEQEEERNVIPPASPLPGPKDNEAEENTDTALGGSEESVDILNIDDDEDGWETAKKNSETGRQHKVLDIDINLPHQAETDDENAEVDINDDEEEVKGPNAAEALKAQVGAEKEENESSSSGTNSGSDSSGSEPGSSSSTSTDTTTAGDSSSG